MSLAMCGRCGEVARGLASINNVRYCHDGESPTCYEWAQRELPAETIHLLTWRSKAD